MPQVIVKKQKSKEEIEALELSRELAKQAYWIEFMEGIRVPTEQVMRTALVTQCRHEYSYVNQSCATDRSSRVSHGDAASAR